MTSQTMELETLIKTYYDSHAKSWIERHSTKGDVYKKEVITFTQLLPGRRILEIGVGGGREIELFKSYGLEYYGVDISLPMTVEAKSRNPLANLSAQNVYNLGFPDNTFSGIWAGALVHHIPPERIDELLMELKRVMQKDAIAFISMRNIEETKTDPLTGLTFFSYPRDAFRSIIERNGFIEVNFDTLSAQTGNYLEFFLKK